MILISSSVDNILTIPSESSTNSEQPPISVLNFGESEEFLSTTSESFSTPSWVEKEWNKLEAKQIQLLKEEIELLNLTISRLKKKSAIQGSKNAELNEKLSELNKKLSELNKKPSVVENIPELNMTMFQQNFYLQLALQEKSSEIKLLKKIVKRQVFLFLKFVLVLFSIYKVIRFIYS